MDFVQPLIISQIKITPFAIPLIRPFTFAGNTLTERTGYYCQAVTVNGLSASGEIAPLPGMSNETLKKAKHDLEELALLLNGWQIPTDKKSSSHLSAARRLYQLLVRRHALALNLFYLGWPQGPIK